MYRTSDRAAPLEFLRVDVDAYVAQNPGLPHDQVRAAANTHNLAIDLARGEGDFADVYFVDDPKNPTPFDPGPTAVAVDSITDALCQCYDPSNHPNAELVHDRLQRLAAVDAAHPMVLNWRILRDRCYPFVDHAPAWDGLPE